MPFAILISIHAPTKGATPPSCSIKYSISISIHAPTKGATRQNRLYCKWVYYFNPRSHEGSDNSTYESYNSLHISIHAPTKGATTVSDCAIRIGKFQSTLPRRERLFCISFLPFIICISIHAPTKGATDIVLLLCHI